MKFKLDAYLNKDITHRFADGPRNGLWEGTRQVSCPLGGGTPYNGLYREAPPERGTFFRLQLYERVGISSAEVYLVYKQT